MRITQMNDIQVQLEDGDLVFPRDDDFLLRIGDNVYRSMRTLPDLKRSHGIADFKYAGRVDVTKSLYSNLEWRVYKKE